MVFTGSKIAVYGWELGILGTRISALLILSYPLHSICDLIHEIQTHTTIIILDAEQLTAIPLAYGIFCATYDIGIAIYFFSRREEWHSDWKVKST